MSMKFPLKLSSSCHKDVQKDVLEFVLDVFPDVVDVFPDAFLDSLFVVYCFINVDIRID